MSSLVNLALRPYPQEALVAIEAAAARGVRRALLVLATGLGKSRYAAVVGTRVGGPHEGRRRDMITGCTGGPA